MRSRELLRFAVGGLWRQKVRTALTLVGVTVGTCALAFSLSLGFGLRAFIENEFKGRDDFWRVTVHAGEAVPDPADLPADKVTVRGVMSDDRRGRIREVLIDKYQAKAPRKEGTLLTPDRVAALAALPEVTEVRTYRSSRGRAWLGDHSTPAFVVAGRLGGLENRLIAGRLPASDEAAEVVLSEFVLYELGVRDDADLEAALGRAVQVDAGAMLGAPPLALARALTGRSLDDDPMTRPQAEALEKLTSALPNALDKFDLTAAERAELKRLLDRKPDPDEERSFESGKVVRGEFRLVGVVRVVTREDRKKRDPLTAWELWQGEAFLPPGSGEKLFDQLPWMRDWGFHSVDVRVRPGGDLEGTVATIEGMGYETFSALKWFRAARREVTLIAAGLNLFALVALFVAGIGITNTLVTSVVERTREIGILKAVGATRSQVLGIFLAEGAAIGLAGAALGLGLARGLVYPADRWVKGLIEQQMQGQRMLSESIFVFPAWLWAGSVLFAVLVTTAAAYYPARRAARIDPIQALRSE
jgi:putative ABC transport system permease protein